MAIQVTTRSAKGSELITAEMDDNLTSLARSSTENLEGNIQIATQVETTALTNNTKAIVPGHLQAAVEGFLTDSVLNVDTLFTGNLGAGTSSVLSFPTTDYTIIAVETEQASTQFSWMFLPSTSIDFAKAYVDTGKIGGDSNSGVVFSFTDADNVKCDSVSQATGVRRVVGIKVG